MEFLRRNIAERLPHYKLKKPATFDKDKDELYAEVCKDFEDKGPICLSLGCRVLFDDRENIARYCEEKGVVVHQVINDSLDRYRYDIFKPRVFATPQEPHPPHIGIGRAVQAFISELRRGIVANKINRAEKIAQHIAEQKAIIDSVPRTPDKPASSSSRAPGELDSYILILN